MSKTLLKAIKELRAETNRVLKYHCHLKPSITREDASALKELRKDKGRVLLTTDKEVVVVVLDKEDYIKIAKGLLVQKDTCRPLTAEIPTNMKTNS